MTNLVYDHVFSQFPDYSKADKKKIKTVVKWAKPYQDILDVGCGRGYYLKAIPRAMGIEPSKYLCDNELQDFNVINTDILSLQTNKVWEALYCMDVLEHLELKELLPTLERLSKLAPKALIGVANHSDIWDGLELHPIQQDEKWWQKQLSGFYTKVTPYKIEPYYYIFSNENT